MANWLHKLMTRFGYKSNAAGLCFGVACIAMQATFLGDLVSLDASFTELAQLFLSGATDASAQLKEFLDGIEHTQIPHFYPAMFNEPISALQVQSALLTQYLAAFKKLNEKGGIAEAADVSGIYTQADLETFFKQLREEVEKNGELSPISIMIRDVRHVIHVGFDPLTSSWSFVDSEKIKTDAAKVVQYFKEDKDIAASVFSAFHAVDNHVALSNKIYTLKSVENKLIPSIQQWKEKLASNNDIVDKSLRGNLLLLAVMHGDVHSAEKILESDSSLANYLSPHANTPLLIAVKTRNLAMVNLLLKHGAKATSRHMSSEAALDHAARMGYGDIVSALLAAPKEQVDVNYRRQDGCTALFLAADAGQHAIIADLLHAGADDNIKWKGFKASDVAFKKKDASMIAVFKAVSAAHQSRAAMKLAS